MTEHDRDDATLYTLHEDLTAGFAEMRALQVDLTAGFVDMRSGITDLKGEIRSGFGDLKATLIAGFRGLPSRESSEEMVRLLREGNRLNEERFTQLDLRIREQHFETQQVLRALVEGQRLLVEGQHLLVEGQRSLSADIKALIARIDALIRGRSNGEPAA